MKRLLIITTLTIAAMGGIVLMAPSPWNTLCPGIQTSDLSTMDQRLARKMNRIFETLDSEGFQYTISSVYRSPEKQQCYYDISQVIKKHTGQNGLTQTTRSCHNHTVKGIPASLAIDVHKHHGSMEDKVEFYKRLRTLARAEGLTSGGDFRQSNPVWAQYGLGWDPGHIQIKGCKNMIQTDTIAAN